MAISQFPGRSADEAAERPLTAGEQRELLDRLRRFQDPTTREYALPAHDVDSVSPPLRGVDRHGGDAVASFDVAEGAVRISATPPRDVTGPGITSCVAMDAADLGILRWDPDRNAMAAMFGDNFEFRGDPSGFHSDWQSPSIVMYDRDYNVLGIPATDNRIVMGRRRQLWDYQHNNGVYSTILPCDFIKVNGVWYVAAMVTAGLKNEKWTVFWQSRDLVNWEKTSPYLSLAHRNEAGHFIGHPGNTMLTFDQIGDYVYIFGTGGLARDRGIWMWRNKAGEFPHGWWEPWGWDGYRWGWGIANENSPILDGGYGELSFRHIDGHCVLSYFDAACYRQQVRTVLSPDHDWRNCAHVVDYAFGVDIPQLYGGYISPLSRLNEPDGMHFFVSQWITATNDPYRVMLVKDTLFATAGPLGDIQPRVRGRSVPDQDSDQAPAELDRSDVVPSPPDYGDRSGQPRRTSYSGAVTGSVAKMPVSPPSPPR